jgi:hypothetical protein
MDQSDKIRFWLDDLICAFDPANLSKEQIATLERFTLGDKFEAMGKEILNYLKPRPFLVGTHVFRDGEVVKWNDEDHELFFQAGEWWTAEGYTIDAYSRAEEGTWTN